MVEQQSPVAQHLQMDTFVFNFRYGCGCREAAKCEEFMLNAQVQYVQHRRSKQSAQVQGGHPRVLSPIQLFNQM